MSLEFKLAIFPGVSLNRENAPASMHFYLNSQALSLLKSFYLLASSYLGLTQVICLFVCWFIYLFTFLLTYSFLQFILLVQRRLFHASGALLQNGQLVRHWAWILYSKVKPSSLWLELGPNQRVSVSLSCIQKSPLLKSLVVAHATSRG